MHIFGRTFGFYAAGPTGRNRDYHVESIRYFSPDGRRTLPNGHPIQKGGFARECSINAKKFGMAGHQQLIDRQFETKQVPPTEQNDLFDSMGGILVLSTDFGDRVEGGEAALVAWMREGIAELFGRRRSFPFSRRVRRAGRSEKKKEVGDYIGAFSVGHFFWGTFPVGSSKFDATSLCVGVVGLSPGDLLFAAEKLAADFEQSIVLIRDMDAGKISLVQRRDVGAAN